MLLTLINTARGYDHIYIAPHLDDAALSCGGQIVLQKAASAAVLMVTICAGSPGQETVLSPFAQYLHGAWALGDDPVARRRAEDLAATEILGCDALHLDQLDAPYRVAAYGERDAVFGSPVPHDPLAAAVTQTLHQLHMQQPKAQLHVPLGVGLHVDHQIVFDASIALHDRGADVIWYEDTPYAATWPNAVEQRLESLQYHFEPEIIEIGAGLKRKLRAIRAYQSQMSELFGTADMVKVMTAYASRLGGAENRFGERVWWRARDD
jgi:LmbE family N-acetylglucosaminyl deacetylase